MSYENCLLILKKAAPNLKDDDYEFILSSLDRKAQYYVNKGLASDSIAAYEKAAGEFAADIRMAALIERRNAAMNLTKRIARTTWAKDTFGTKITEAIETLIVGTNRAVTGARSGVMQMQHMLGKQYHAGFTADLVRQDLHALWSSGTLDREAARALWAFGKPDEAAQLGKLPKEAVEIARIVDKWQETTRLDANREGAWIGKITGYITRQSHDPYRIRTRGGKDGVDWKADAGRWFELDRMMAEQDYANPTEMLDSIYTNLYTGNHMKAIAEPSGGFTGSANLAKRMSQERVIHFRDADAWFDYNEKYGTGNLRESVSLGLRHSAQSTGLMKVLGTNPRDMIKRIEHELVTTAKAAGALEDIKQYMSSQNTLGYYMDSVDGTMNIPGNAIFARRAANVRGWEILTKLGNMIASQFNDVAIYGAAARHDGKGFLSGMGEALGSLGKTLKDKERFELYSALDVSIESMIGDLGRTGSFDEAGGISKYIQLFMKWNLSTPWTERLRVGAQTGLSHHLALQKTKAFSALDPDLQRKLSVYGIDATKWDTLRNATTKTFDGKEFMVPEAVADRDLADALRNYLIDRTEFYVINTDAKSRALMLRGTRPGTPEGEFARFMMQFKGFTGAYIQKSLGQELYGRGFEGYGVMNALRNGHGEMQGIAALIAMSTLLGYASLTLKDLMKNKTPRDVTDPEIAYKTFLASMVQGGGFGIYGDFLFAESSRIGSSTLETALGPAMSDFGKVLDLYRRAIRGDETAAHAVNTALGLLPINILGSRTALDYLIIHDIQDSMNPGYLRRTERRMEQDYGQEFLVRPQ